ncbi:K(+)-transporting ATPase subunit F [Cellulomonas timonensis]|nr:K(+)-transporting ATPase subunit F [Cellulomonas timonensis]
MTGADWAALVVTAAVLVYLFVALIRPDSTR